MANAKTSSSAPVANKLVTVEQLNAMDSVQILALDKAEVDPSAHSLLNKLRFAAKAKAAATRSADIKVMKGFEVGIHKAILFHDALEGVDHPFLRMCDAEGMPTKDSYVAFTFSDETRTFYAKRTVNLRTDSEGDMLDDDLKAYKKIVESHLGESFNIEQMLVFGDKLIGTPVWIEIVPELTSRGIQNKIGRWSLEELQPAGFVRDRRGSSSKPSVSMNPVSESNLPS